MRYFLYARKSSEDKKKQIQSIPDQIRVLTDVAKSRGMEIVEIITDERTAKEPGRKGFTQMIKRIQKDEAEGILCWKLDRLARNMIDGGSVVWLLQEGTIKEIVTPEKVYLPTENTLILNFEFGMATQFSRDLGKNSERGTQSKIDQGWFPGIAPLGYLNEPNGQKGQKKIHIDPVLFPVIQSLWKTILKDRCSLSELYEIMKRDCPIYSRGKLLSYGGFHRMMHNPFYCGLFVRKGMTYVGLHTPMITQSEFEDAQDLLKNGQGLRKRVLQFDLKGLFRCGHCGGFITSENHQKLVKTTGKIGTYIYHRCSRTKKDIKCTEKAVSESKISDQILSEIENMQIPDEIISFGLETLDSMDASAEVSIKQQQLQKEIASISQRLNVIQSNLAEEPDASIRQMMKSRFTELSVQKRRLEEDLQLAIQECAEPYVEIKDRLTLIRNAKSVFLNGTADQKRDVVRGLGLNWQLSGRKLQYDPHFVTSALQKTRKQLQQGKYGFELAKSQSETGRTLTNEQVNLVWSRRPDLNR